MTCEQRSPSICFFLAAFVTILLTAGSRAANRVDVPDPGIMLPLVPAAATTGAPPVIKPGTRLTYFGMTASIPGAYGKLVQDDEGNWVDKATGQRYRQEKINSGAAAAFSVVSVGHVGDGVALLSTKVYTLDTATRKCTFATGFGTVGHAGCAADYWIHPEALKQVQEVNTEGIRILRMPYTVAGRTYNAIRFQRDEASGYQARMYDLETGLLIFHASRVQGPAVMTAPIGGAGRAGMGEGSAQIVTLWIVEAKDIDVPWKNAAAPQWIAEFGQLSYRGLQTSVVTAAGSKLDRAMTATLTPKARGRGWVRFTNRFLIEGLPGMPPNEVSQEGASGPASIGGLWIPPEALAGLRPQQVIERNDHVGTIVAVSRVEPGSVTITETGPLHRVDSTYDRQTGMLSATTVMQEIGLARITHSVRLVGR